MADDRELRMRCVEVAAGIAARQVRNDAGTVVEIATVLYDYVNAPRITSETTEPANTDKQKRKKSPDILS